MVWMMAAHLDRPECDAGYSGTLLSKDEENEPKRTPHAAKYQCIIMFMLTTLIISKKPGNTGISRDIRTEFTTDLLLSD
ncbi:hypothetical protein M5E83_05225 [Bifidobacterium adolescentis]|uniref:hypothetical protein n=1 Tax=Bifidobacterium adolescentis TaxID=1680 RepID=UPI00201B652C|nr:hypothetical protein [Bifidobacterium adolescentis]UQT38297.1 hypothetical protein M5E83_05225 [Bifidobacterium adolescentis]